MWRLDDLSDDVPTVRTYPTIGSESHLKDGEQTSSHDTGYRGPSQGRRLYFESVSQRTAGMSPRYLLDTYTTAYIRSSALPYTPGPKLGTLSCSSRYVFSVLLTL